jgi:hypothetical protein
MNKIKWTISETGGKHAEFGNLFERFQATIIPLKGGRCLASLDRNGVSVFSQFMTQRSAIFKIKQYLR